MILPFRYVRHISDPSRYIGILFQTYNTANRNRIILCKRKVCLIRCLATN